jgi:hypothetical protein
MTKPRAMSQKCKEWIAGNIAPSAPRTAALGKYLSSFSKHTQPESQINSKATGASKSRRQLHILYLIHDVAHHAKYHTSNLSAFSTFTASIQPFLVELVQSAASERRARVSSRIHDLLEVWESERFYLRDYINKLRQAVTGTNASEQEKNDNETRELPAQKESNGAAFRMPASHGDPETPYYDLPAGNLLPLLEPGSSAPIRPEQVRALRFNSGPADMPLVNALKDFLKDVESIEHKYTIRDVDQGMSEIDELGQITLRGETGDITGDTYYGWSRAFCEKMKRRRKEQGSDNIQRRSLSRESSRSSSRSAVKRRRYSDFDRDRSATRSRSPPRFRAASPVNIIAEQGRWQPAPGPRLFASGVQSGPPPMLHSLPSNPIPFQAPSLGPNGVPLPPPRPANWNGPWPPPPPPVGVSFPYPNVRGNNNFPPRQPPPPPPGYPSSYDYGGSYR